MKAHAITVALGTSYTSECSCCGHKRTMGRTTIVVVEDNDQIPAEICKQVNDGKLPLEHLHPGLIERFTREGLLN